MGSFINPYTFIPVNKGRKKLYGDYYSQKNLLTGKIECHIITKTQLAVCDKVGEQDFNFYSVGGKAVIPGSSIRGSIRSIYEALTDSCLSSTNAEDDDYFSSRLNKDKTGLLAFEKDKYVLYKARRYKDEKNQYLGNMKTGDMISFDGYSNHGVNGDEVYYLKNVNKGSKKGYVHKVNRLMQSKDSVFEKNGDPFEISKKAVDLLERNLKKYESKTPKIAENFSKQFNQMKNGNGYLPVWYIENNGNVYLAPSQMSRSLFFTRPLDMLRKNNLEPCSDENSICDACSLFGTVHTEKAFASRLRFSDAVCDDGDCFDKKVIMPILASPRLSSFEFYLDSNKNKYSADDEGVNIAGRKYYWHNNFKHYPDNNNRELTKMNSSVQLVKKGSRFDFTLFFDEITEEQLKKLIFSLNLGDNSENSDKCHKFGHGKPIGLGSVKVCVDNITQRSFISGEYTEEKINIDDYKSLENVFENRKNVDNILKVTNFNAVDGKLISYPHTDSSNDIFKWFANNRKTLRTKGAAMEYKTKLPKLTDADQKIKCEQADNHQSRSNSNSGRNRRY